MYVTFYSISQHNVDVVECYDLKFVYVKERKVNKLVNGTYVDKVDWMLILKLVF